MIHKLIFKLGTKRRNPSLLSYYDFLKQSEKKSYEELLQYQFEKLKDFLVFAETYSIYYKTLFENIGFNPKAMTTLADLEKLPIISKNDLIKHSKEIQSTFAFNKLLYSETSGTSGQPLTMYRNEEWDSHNRATMFRGYSWHGVQPWDRNGYFWGYNFSFKQRIKTQALDFLQNRFRIFNYNDDSIIRFTKKLKKTKYIHGYSSMIYEVAKRVNQLGLDGAFNLKMIKGTSEKIYPSYQNEVQKAFGKKIISEYGAAESGIIAFECKQGSMHLNMEGVILEEVDGEAVVTNLLSKSFPIIRYKLGDYIKLAPQDYKCNCGMNAPVLLEIEGRVGKKVIGKVNNYPSLTFYYVFKNLVLNHDVTLNYQAVQDVPGEILLKIEQEFNEENHKFLLVEIKKYFGSDIDFTIQYGEKLHAMEGKLKDFITVLD